MSTRSPAPAAHAPRAAIAFAPAPRSAWAGVSDAAWGDWRWQQRHRITAIDQLERIVRLAPEERNAAGHADAVFRMAITPYYAALMDPEDPACPIRRQCVPTVHELAVTPSDREDPLAEERDMPVSGLTHRYPDRVLLYATHECAVYCRHCTRKRKVADTRRAVATRHLEAARAYVARHREVRDVLISGGDPLLLSDERLDTLLGRFRALEHVEIIRLGTRTPVTLPQRVTADLVAMIRAHHPVYVNTHFNHPIECTAEALAAAERLADAGCVLGNQMVLLKGVNDDPKVVLELNQKLLRMRIRPYYIYQCDLARGIHHFRTPVEVGVRIIESLRGHTSGLAVPHFVIDAPDGGGKIPLAPNYVVNRNGRSWTLRSYAGGEYVYEEP